MDLAAEMETAIISITPDMATAWLEHNTKNRPSRQSHIDGLAAAMRRGEFKTTHQGIAFDPEGVLLDGQHRLWAIVESGCTIRMMVTKNMDRDTFAATDLMMKRTNSDILGHGVYELQVSSALYALMDSTHIKPTPTQVSAIHDVFGPTIHDLHRFCSKRSAVFGAASARAMVVLRAMTGDRDYAFNIYEGLNLNKPGMVPPIAQSYYKAVKDGRSSSDKKDIACRMWYATDRKRADFTRMQVPDMSEAMGGIREAVRRVGNGVFG